MSNKPTILVVDDEPGILENVAGLLCYHIRNVRRKLEDVGISGDLIASVRSVGYRLDAEVISR